MTYKASMHPPKVEGSVIQEPQTNCHLVSEARKLFCLFLNLVVDFEGVFFSTRMKCKCRRTGTLA